MRNLEQVTLGLASLFLASLAQIAFGFDRLAGEPFASRSEVLAQSGMAATSQPLATQVAIDTLKKGGSAVDAAIAANAMLGLVEASGCGIGGDLFAIVWDAKTKTLHALNASGRAPGRLSIADFERMGHRTVPHRGPLSVTVPGTIDGWFELHGRFGHLSMQEILAPAIAYANKGFPVSQTIAEAWEKHATALTGYAEFRRIFLPGGRAPRKGEIFRNPDLGATYAAIAEKGRDEFYEGEIALKIVSSLTRLGGYLDLEDLSKQRAEWVNPVSTTYRGYTIWELPPNSQGIAVLQMLNIIEQFDVASMGIGSADWLHLFIEAKKLAYEDRARFYADMRFYDAPIDHLISKEYAERLSQRIQLRHASSVQVTSDDPVHGDTIYLSTADKEGNMVSLIQSNFAGWGSGIVPAGLGFPLQNRGASFSLDPAHANAFAPGKRPFHTIIPGFVTRDDAPLLAFGVMGGDFQPQGHVQILVNLIDFGMNLQEAGDAARTRHNGSSQPTGQNGEGRGVVYIERGIEPGVVQELRERGHEVAVGNEFFGGYQAVLRNPLTGVYSGASESRFDGQAAGY